MSKDLYPALTGAAATWQQMNFIANNLSNVNTNGYKSKRVAFQAFGERTGLLAQGYSPHETAVLGVYLHGLAGDLAAANMGMEAMIAGDITDYLGEAYKQINSEN